MHHSWYSFAMKFRAKFFFNCLINGKDNFWTYLFNRSLTFDSFFFVFWSFRFLRSFQYRNFPFENVYFFVLFQTAFSKINEYCCMMIRNTNLLINSIYFRSISTGNLLTTLNKGLRKILRINLLIKYYLKRSTFKLWLLR